jgi:hypothetical protein
VRCQRARVDRNGRSDAAAGGRGVCARARGRSLAPLRALRFVASATPSGAGATIAAAAARRDRVAVAREGVARPSGARLIAIDRALHFFVLALLSVAVFLFASHELRLRHVFYRVANAVQGSAGGPTHNAHGGFFASLRHVFDLSSRTLYAVAAAAAAYALLEGVEAVGLWFQKRWAEYLTFVATALFIPYEVYELLGTVSPFKILALVVNVAIALYLLFAKRLFGLRGGAAAERAERQRDSGWEALERTAPAEQDRAAA